MVSTGPAKVVPYPAAINTVTGICRDPKNEPILECAERAEAECMSLASYRGIRIMTARDYVEAR